MPRRSGVLPTWNEWDARLRAKVETFEPLGPEERLNSLRQQGFFPHGIYLPEHDRLRAETLSTQRVIGDDPDVDSRMRRYLELQEFGEMVESKGVAGRWTGQMGVVKSPARFRIVAWGRRGGKTILSANEAVAHARTRPRSWVWIVGRTMKTVGRCFDMVDTLIRDLNIPYETRRSTEQHRLFVLENGSKIEGISLDNPMTAAGAAVDLAVVDEAAQIDESSWTRVVLPPLADRQGRALVISSFEGEGGFFYDKVEQARAHSDVQGIDPDWDLFQDPSWEVNFYRFPQGKQSPEILLQRREMDPIDFLEQYGAIPAKAKELVYPEFRERVHVLDVKYDPTHPVYVGVDPTGGSSPYAITVWQDYGHKVNIIDEFWQPGGTSAAEISPILKKRAWADNVSDMVVDSAAYTEAEYWARLGWPAYPVHEKPPITERIPVYRNMLRDPKAYYDLYRALMNERLVAEGHPENWDFLLSPEEERRLVLEIETSLSDQNISARHLELLRRCSRIFIHPSCVNTIREHKTYKFPKKRPGMNVRDNPVDRDNDLLDAGGYLTWTFHRFDEHVLPPVDAAGHGMDLVRSLGRESVPEVVDMRIPSPHEANHRGFLAHVRSQFGQAENRIYSRVGTLGE